MPDTSDLFNPPRPQFPLLRHPLLLLALALILYGTGSVIYRLMRPAPATAPTPLKPNGDWIGEITMDGRDWMPTMNGDTPDRTATLSFTSISRRRTASSTTTPATVPCASSVSRSRALSVPTTGSLIPTAPSSSLFSPPPRSSTMNSNVRSTAAISSARLADP